MGAHMTVYRYASTVDLRVEYLNDGDRHIQLSTTLPYRGIIEYWNRLPGGYVSGAYDYHKRAELFVYDEEG